MELTCSCGNSFNFGEPDTNPNGQMEGFEFATSEDNEGEEMLLIHCLKCNKTLCMYE